VLKLHVSSKKLLNDLLNDKETQSIFELGVGGGIICVFFWTFCCVCWLCVYLKTHNKQLKYEIIDVNKEPETTSLI